MINQPRFNLNAAIENWRQELAAQIDLSPEVRRELETHVRDTIAELKRRGLNDEESFWLARRRIGQPRQLGEEFAKADPAKVWRERLFWVVIGLFGMRLWSGAPMYFLDRIHSLMTRAIANNFFLPDWVLFYVPLHLQWLNEHLFLNPIFNISFRFLPFVCLVILFARGRMDKALSTFQFFFRSRRRFLLTAVAVFGVYYTWAIFDCLRYVNQMTPGLDTPNLTFLIQRGLGNAVVSAMFVALIAWLLPTQSRTASKHA